MVTVLEFLSMILIAFRKIFGSSLMGLGALIPAAAGATPADLPMAIAQARFYAWGLVGTPGQISDEERAARVIAGDWPSQKLVASISQANVEGRLYLLCVARRKFPDDYENAKSLAGFSAGQQVSIFSGSVLQKVEAEDLIRQLEASHCAPLGWPQ